MIPSIDDGEFEVTLRWRWRWAMGDGDVKAPPYLPPSALLCSALFWSGLVSSTLPCPHRPASLPSRHPSTIRLPFPLSPFLLCLAWSGEGRGGEGVLIPYRRRRTPMVLVHRGTAMGGQQRRYLWSGDITRGVEVPALLGGEPCRHVGPDGSGLMGGRGREKGRGGQ